MAHCKIWRSNIIDKNNGSQLFFVMSLYISIMIYNATNDTCLIDTLLTIHSILNFSQLITVFPTFATGKRGRFLSPGFQPGPERAEKTASVLFCHRFFCQTVELSISEGIYWRLTSTPCTRNTSPHATPIENRRAFGTDPSLCAANIRSATGQP